MIQRLSVIRHKMCSLCTHTAPLTTHHCVQHSSSVLARSAKIVTHRDSSTLVVMSGFSKTFLTTLYWEMQLTWLMIDCSNSCTMSSQRLRNHADHQRGLVSRRSLRYRLYLAWRGACCSRSQSSSAWWFVHPSRSKYHCSRGNSHQAEISLSHVIVPIYLTLFLSLIASMSTILRRASNRSSVRCFVPRSATLEILGSRFNVTLFQRDILLGQCIVNPQKSDIYVF